MCNKLAIIEQLQINNHKKKKYTTMLVIISTSLKLIE